MCYKKILHKSELDIYLFVVNRIFKAAHFFPASNGDENKQMFTTVSVRLKECHTCGTVHKQTKPLLLLNLSTITINVSCTAS